MEEDLQLGQQWTTLDSVYITTLPNYVQAIVCNLDVLRSMIQSLEVRLDTLCTAKQSVDSQPSKADQTEAQPAVNRKRKRKAPVAAGEREPIKRTTATPKGIIDPLKPSDSIGLPHPSSTAPSTSVPVTAAGPVPIAPLLPVPDAIVLPLKGLQPKLRLHKHGLYATGCKVEALVSPTTASGFTPSTPLMSMVDANISPVHPFDSQRRSDQAPMPAANQTSNTHGLSDISSPRLHECMAPGSMTSTSHGMTLKTETVPTSTFTAPHGTKATHTTGVARVALGSSCFNCGAPVELSDGLPSFLCSECDLHLTETGKSRPVEAYRATTRLGPSNAYMYRPEYMRI